MPESTPNIEAGVNSRAFVSILTISTVAIPVALIPISDVARSLGVSTAQVNSWCDSGQLAGSRHNGAWWVSVGALTSFVERSSWQLVAAPKSK